MADRITRVSLTANVTNYISGMTRATAATRGASDAAERLAGQRQAFTALGTGVTAFGAVAAAGVAIAVKKFADFDQAVSGIQAATHASTKDMLLLRDAAIDAGAKTVYSATEAANAITELSKAGVSTADILGGGLDGALSLAAAGQINVADAASYAATAMTQFGLKGSAVPHIADLLAAGAGKAQGSVTDLANALNQGGLVASQAGQSIDETTGVLAAFASQGLLGSDAGTSLKTALLALENPSSQAAGVMSKYGINVYDAAGNMDSFQEIAGTLSTQLNGLTDEQRNSALATIFGSDAVRAANVLYSEGSDGIAKWTANVNDNAYAAETARIQLDNLKGDLEQLGGALDTALIQTGSGANGALRDLTKGATGLVNAFGDAGPAAQNTVLVLGAVTAATALTGGGFLLVVPKVAAAKAAMVSMNLTARRLAVGLGIGGGVALALTAITAGFSNLGSTADLTSDQIARLNSSARVGNIASLNKQFTAGQGDAGLLATQITGVKSALNELDNHGTKNTIAGFLGLADVTKTAEAQFAQLGTSLGDIARSSLPDASDGFNKIVKAAGGGSKTAASLLEKMPDYTAALTDLATEAGVTLTKQQLLNLAQGKGAIAAELSTTASQKQSDGLAALSGTAVAAKGDVSDLSKAITDFGKTQFDVNQTQRDFQQAIDDATQALKDNGQTTDATTEKGRANAEALDKIASSALDSAAALSQTENGQKKAYKAITDGRKAYIDASVAAGVSRSAAAKYADALGLIPSNVGTAIALTGVQAAQSAIDRFLATNDGRIINIQTKNNVSTITTGSGMRASVGDDVVRAGGGPISGPGTATSDSIPAWLSDGEYVVKASSVAKYGQGFLDRVNAGKYAEGGAVRKFANGGVADFLTSIRRGDLTGTSGIDQLFTMAQDADTFKSAVQRNSFQVAAVNADTALVKLEASSEKASKAVASASSALDNAKSKLNSLRDASKSLASSTADSVSKFSVSDYGSAAGLQFGLKANKGSVKEFTTLLATLRKKGLSSVLIAEIEAMGSEEGIPLARSLAASTTANIKSINSDFTAARSTAKAYGQSVADAQYGKQIKAAESGVRVARAQLTAANKHAKQITDAITTQGKAVQRVIGKALHAPGYADGGYTGDGARNKVAGIVHAGEYVVNAKATANLRNRSMLEAMNAGYPGYASGGYVQPVYVRSNTGGGEGLDYKRLAEAVVQSARPIEQHFSFPSNNPAAIAQFVSRRQMVGNY